jgi:maleylacetoacetate isomerase
VAGAKLTGVDLADFPASVAIAERALALEAFARAHPLRQPGAPGR